MEVTRDDMEIVSALRAALADKVGKERFELWFGPGTWFRLDQRALTVGVPNRFFRDWIRSNFRRQIESACLEVLGNCPSVKYIVDDALAAPAAAATPAGDCPDFRAETRSVGPKMGLSPLVDAAEKAPPPSAAGDAPRNGDPLPAGRRKFSALSSFVTGQSNRLAFVSAEMVAQHPGGSRRC